MKKITSVFLVFLLILSLASCNKTADVLEDSKLSVVATVFPVYDWVKNIVGDVREAQLTMLLDTGVDLHSFQPTTEDLMKINSCDVFIYVGGESDEWVEDAMKTLTSDDKPVIINLMDTLGDSLKEEEAVEGMEIEEEEEDHDHGEAEFDEHIWLSLKNAKVCVEEISKALCSADPENSDRYKKSAEEYISELAELDKKYEEAAENAQFDTVLFGDRFPFRYMTEDYGLNYYAAFMGCSAETEASFETVSFLSEKVRELGLKTVLTLEGTNHSLAETIVKNSGTDAQILYMDSMQSVTSEDVKNGADYLAIMEKNLEVLKKALN